MSTFPGGVAGSASGRASCGAVAAGTAMGSGTAGDRLASSRTGVRQRLRRWALAHRAGRGECGRAKGFDIALGVDGRCLGRFWNRATRIGTPSVARGNQMNTATGAASTVRDLHHGDAMRLEDASVITVSGPSRLIVLAGEGDSGKTTVITSLYERFLKGPFCNLLFAGSLTLPGFEQRVFDARMDSGRELPHTPHTSLREGLRVLHLGLVHQGTGPHWHLLFGDLAGERYRACRESTSDAQELNCLGRADRVCLLLNGERLADPRMRHGELEDGEGTLRSLVEARVLGLHSKIDVVCSKWDLVYGDDAAAHFVVVAFDRLRQAFETEFSELHFDRIAARPARVIASVQFGFGLDKLLERWTMPDPPMARVEPPLPAPQLSDREFTRFAGRFPERSDHD